MRQAQRRSSEWLRCATSAAETMTPAETTGTTETLKRLGVRCEPDLDTVATAKPETQIELHATPPPHQRRRGYAA